MPKPMMSSPDPAASGNLLHGDSRVMTGRKPVMPPPDQLGPSNPGIPGRGIPMSGTPPFMRPALAPHRFAQPLQNYAPPDEAGMSDSGAMPALPSGPGNYANTAAGMGFSFGSPQGGAPAASLAGDYQNIDMGKPPGGFSDMVYRPGPGEQIPGYQGGFGTMPAQQDGRARLAQLLANPAVRGKLV